MDDLWRTVIEKAFWDSLSSIGQSGQGIAFIVITLIVGSFAELYRKGWEWVRRHYVKAFLRGALYPVLAWILVFLFHLHYAPYSLYKIERERAEKATSAIKEKEGTISAQNKIIQDLKARPREPAKTKEPERGDLRPNVKIVWARLGPLGGVNVVGFQLRNFGNAEASATARLQTKIRNKISETDPLDVVLAPTEERSATIEVDDPDYEVIRTGKVTLEASISIDYRGESSGGSYTYDWVGIYDHQAKLFKVAREETRPGGKLR